jgi:hypothetical protein
VCATLLPLGARLQSVYSFPKDDTVLRKNYYDQTTKKKELALASVGKQYAKAYKEIYEDQFEEIGGLWQSTRPVTSTEAYSYLQSVVQKIIAANPELKGTDARIVFTRDWWPNAVSMGDGSIAINAGLFVFMSNEAELAFVICHELSHYYLEHTPKKIKKYIETVNSDEYQAELKRIAKTTYGAGKQLEEFAKTAAFGSHRHSREFEAAADKQGYLFLKNTGYDIGAIRTTLEMLDRIDDTSLFKPLILDKVLNTAEYPFKKKWIQKESVIFAQVEDNSSLTEKEKDSLKTHPDCTKRIALLADQVNAGAGGKTFQVNEKLFNQLKKDLFLEITEECYREKNLGRNLYYNLLLLQAGEYKELAVYSIARCLNELYDKQKEHKLGTAVGTETKGNAEDYNLLLRMLGKVRLDEIAALNAAFCNAHAAEMKETAGFEKEWIKAKKLKEQQP